MAIRSGSPFCVLSFLLCSAELLLPAQAVAGQSQPPAAAPPIVSFTDGRLKIDATDKTLSEILSQLSIATKVKIDLPLDAINERLPRVELGPGPPREVLASLLRDAHLSYLIQGSEADPQQIQSVLLMPADSRGISSDPEPTMPPVRSTYARSTPPSVNADANSASSLQPAEASASLAAASAAPTSASPQPVDDVAAQTQAAAAALSSAATDQLAQSSLSPPAQLNGARVAPLNPPPVMNSQSINQQLQQMYQQRVQIVQQDRANPSPAGLSGPSAGGLASHD